MKRLGTRLALLVALGCAIAPTTGVAQPASALGQMLPDGSLPTGTLSVKVIAGESAKILPGTDVHVTINGDERIARTGPDGRATLPGVPAGATIKVTIKGASGDVSSDTLTMPDNGGARVMLSTVPMIDTSATGAPPPMAAGGAGRPQPRQMSGKARPDPSVPGGELQVLVTYDELFSKTPPVGEPVMLVGYRADEKIAVMVEKTDDTGHVHFKDLDRSGGTVYFAMARLPRGTGVDRMWSVPIQMDPTAGAKAMLSAEARTSTAKPVDDLAMVEPQPVLPSGRVMASIVGVPEDPGTVSLVDAATGKVVMTAKTEPETPAPGSVTVDTSPLTPDKSTGTAVLGIQLAHAGAAGVVPVPDVNVMVRRAPIPPPPAAAPAKAGAGSAGSGSAAPSAGSGSAAPGA
ncbi:MAG: hypothetical protein K8W52_12725, partial [Deltaproteobacteria bacterium]|nr:hypothetical protein [Deltaproteobacteria bacterium]